ncbi:hypothetical protein [Paenibacillus mucilaginosus]|uniref:Uncharacterized protein n=1 Tax=Paenibacillus mucilaginosus (strain KNP414) TaxID=1036673 RepID=F8FH75_PAEMK|nr:hypothetical protein [Paenibacillus mucilaginosus]AEI39777.1 hypothetical protein KNP414_01210 [Paenibacillus mucilaginosus KNP414]MCG7217368.1 hypothetical protein [Paenibacillus mucilaginosus]WDM29063.1 hypothetical protein KCX80_07815 [Paenibacillus mucilaginosus]
MSNGKTVLERVSNFVRESGFELTVVEIQDDRGMATYDYSKSLIELNSVAFEKEAEKKGLSIDEVIILVVSHELGHALDQDLVKDSEEITAVFQIIQDTGFTDKLMNRILELTLKAEKSAWEIGGQFVPEHLKSIYNKMNESNLKASETFTIRRVMKFLSLLETEQKLKNELRALNGEAL